MFFLLRYAQITFELQAFGVLNEEKKKKQRINVKEPNKKNDGILNI